MAAKRDPHRQAEKAIRRLCRILGKEYKRNIGYLHRNSGQPEEVAAISDVLFFLSQCQLDMNTMRQEMPITPEVAAEFAELAAEEALDILVRNSSPLGRAALADVLKALFVAQTNLPVPSPELRTKKSTRKFLVHSEFLYQAHRALFPAERMLVAAGRKSNGITTLTALFEVTGTSHSVHVQADARQLGRALIAMDSSDSFLMGWIHSHPGSGPGATTPSSIDRRQQDEWLKDFSTDLLGMIMVEGGFVRLWGPAVEKEKVKVEIVGSGVEATGEKHVYRIQV